MQIVKTIQSCETNMITPNHLDLQMDRIFIDPLTNQVKCIYWPAVNNANEIPPHRFLKQLPYNIQFDSRENTDYVEQYVNSFDSDGTFSLKKLTALLQKLMGAGAKADEGYPFAFERPQKAPPPAHRIEFDPFSGLSGTWQQPASVPGSSVCCPTCGVQNPQGAMYCFMCGSQIARSDIQFPSAPIRMDCPQPPENGLDQVNKGETYPIEDMYDDSGTTVLGKQRQASPSLLQTRTGRRVTITTSSFCIGKDPSVCHLPVVDNVYISRCHVEIVNRNGQYLIRDLKSKNKTFCNGTTLIPELEYQLMDGAHIVLGNEEFIFNY